MPSLLSRIGRALVVALVVMSGTLHAAAQTQTATPQSPELAEASRLAAEVVQLYNKKQYDDALPLARRVLDIREQALGKEHPLVGEAAQNVAAVQLAKKNYGEALSFYQRALKIFEKAYGPDGIKLATTLDNIGWLYVAQGSAGQAEGAFLRALAIREKALGPDHPDLAQPLYMLGQLYDEMGRFGRAVNYYKRAIAIKEKAPAPNAIPLADYLEKCACALTADGNHEGYEMMKRARAVRDQAGPGNSQRVTGQVLQGKATVRIEPTYPLEARRQRLSGYVIVEVTVDETGHVINARAVCGPGLLRESSVEAARQWRFTPTTVDGVAKKVIGTITFNYNM